MSGLLLKGSRLSAGQQGGVCVGGAAVGSPLPALPVDAGRGTPAVHLASSPHQNDARGFHISEDVFAGYNHTLRGGKTKFKEYISVGKGRDMGFDSINSFESKVCGVGRACRRLGRPSALSGGQACWPPDRDLPPQGSFLRLTPLPRHPAGVWREWGAGHVP